VQASRTAVPPTLDGDVLSDPAWAGLAAATGFIQTTPSEGEPASEKTEVFVTFDGETLFIGVVCHDRDPDGIIISDSRRDAALEETDSFRMVLDTFGDRETGYIFGTNPSGLQYDAQVARDGEVQIGSSGGFDLSWNGDWKVAAQIFEGGWSAEFAIPFRTIRFARENPQTWGLNFQRNIRRRKESSFWAPLPRQFGLDRVSRAGSLEGIEVPYQRYLQVTPFVLAESQEGGDGTSSREEDLEAGFDLKYGITPSLALDATYNTDFAQVEADVQQINLDRFSLFFPEKRPFFLENSGIFRVGVPTELELFFSRRIGLGPGGTEIPIDGGARLSGKAGKTNVGLLYMRTDSVEDVAPENDFAVVRLRRDLPNCSSVGMLVTSREGHGSFEGQVDEGQTYAVDGRWGIGDHGGLNAFLAQTDTPGAQEDEYAFRVGGRWDSDTWVMAANYTEVGEDFKPEVGFVNRTGYRKPDLFVLRRHRPKDLWGLHEIRPHFFYRSFFAFDGFHESGFLHVDNHWEFKNGHEIHTGVNFRREGVREPFEIFRGIEVPVGVYEHAELQLVGWTNRGAPLGFEMTVVAGGYFGGDRLLIAPSFRFRSGEKFNGEIAWRYNDIDLEDDAFEANLGRLRLSYSFTPKIFLDGLLQYNNSLDEWSSNIRFGWQEDSGTGLYVVYNEIQEIGRNTLPAQRRLIIKYSRLFNLLGGS